jgi:hypothetical protein
MNERARPGGHAIVRFVPAALRGIRRREPTIADGVDGRRVMCDYYNIDYSTIASGEGIDATGLGA